MTLTQALEAFLLDCEARGLAVGTLRRYRLQLGAAVTWLLRLGVETLADIEATHLRRYLVGELARGLASSSQHAEARALRAWFNFLEQEDVLPGKNPMRAVRMPKLEEKLLPAVGLDDVRRLLEACEDSRDPLRDQAILLVLVDTGIRAAELCELRMCDLAGGRLLIHGKGGKERAVFIGDGVRRALSEYLTTRPGAHADAPLFVVAQVGKLRLAPNGTPIPRNAAGDAFTYDTLRDLLERLGARSGVAVHAHALRRTFAVESLRAGCDLVRLARLMGHADLKMLQAHYLPLVEDDLQDAHRRTSPGDRLRG